MVKKKADFDDKLSNGNRKITSNKSKYLPVENEFKKLKRFDSSCFIGKNYFEEDGSQNYLVFQPIMKYFKVNIIIGATDYILSWKPQELFDEFIKPFATSDNSLKPAISYYYAHKIRVKFTGSCLRQSKITYTHEKIVNIYIVY